MILRLSGYHGTVGFRFEPGNDPDRMPFEGCRRCSDRIIWNWMSGLLATAPVSITGIFPLFRDISKIRINGLNIVGFDIVEVLPEYDTMHM